MITTDEQLIKTINKVINDGLSKQLSIMIKNKKYNSARYFINDEIESNSNKSIKILNNIEDYLIDKIITKEIEK